MTNILVVSDTHGNYSAVVDLVINLTEVDYIIHLGDYAEDAEYIEELTGVKTLVVLGNNDYSYIGRVPEQLMIEESGIKILAVHGHREAVGYNLSRIKKLGKNKDVDIVLFGHTHAYEDVTEDGIRYVNPGSPSLPRGRERVKSVALLRIKDGYEIERITL